MQACIVFGRASSRLYVAYAPFVLLGALAASECRKRFFRLPAPACCVKACSQRPVQPCVFSARPVPARPWPRVG